MQKLKDAIPPIVTSGIFANITEPLWADDFLASDLDLHFASRYGSKWVSPLIEMLEDTDKEVKGTNLTTLANSIYRIRVTEWSHLYADLKAEYDPIENTDYVESETIVTDNDTTQGNTRTLNTANSNTRTLNTTNVVDNDSTSSSTGATTVQGTGAVNKFGFDSVSAVGDTTTSDTTGTQASTTGSGTLDVTTTDRGTISDAGTDTGTITDSGSGTKDETITRNLSKHGNIGVMTNVQLLRDDTDFWKWSFIDVIFEDVAQMVTLSVY